MNTNRKLNCYIFSNLIISFLTLNMYLTDHSSNLVLVNKEDNSSLNPIYELNTDSSVLEQENVLTIVVSNKVVQSKNTTNINYIKPSYNSVTGNNLVNYAKHYLGLRYVSNGNSLETGTDCSGFTKLIYQEFGISLGRTVNSQIYSGSYVSKSDLKPGDLVFYGNSSYYASHVAIYIGNGLVIHESNPNDGVKISPVNMMVYITARRVITENIVSNQEILITNDKQETSLIESEETKEENDNSIPTEKEELKDDIDISLKEENLDEIIQDIPLENETQEFQEINSNESNNSNNNQLSENIDENKINEDETETKIEIENEIEIKEENKEEPVIEANQESNDLEDEIIESISEDVTESSK